MEEVGSFDHITLWDHDALPDEKENFFARGVNEWVAFAESVSLSSLMLDMILG